MFTVASLRQLLEDEGFVIRTLSGVAPPLPKGLGRGPLAMAAMRAAELLARVRPQLFGYQIYVEAEPTPNAETVLARARVGRVSRSMPAPPLPKAPAANDPEPVVATTASRQR